MKILQDKDKKTLTAQDKKKIAEYELGDKFAKELMTPKYRSRIVKPKKGKGSFKRKKNKYLE